MLSGICPRCGSVYHGWALEEPDKQRCQNCGARLKISRTTDDTNAISLPAIESNVKTTTVFLPRDISRLNNN